MHWFYAIAFNLNSKLIDFTMVANSNNANKYSESLQLVIHISDKDLKILFGYLCDNIMIV